MEEEITMKKWISLGLLFFLSPNLYAVEITAAPEKVRCLKWEANPIYHDDDGHFVVYVFDKEIFHVRDINPGTAVVYEAHCLSVLERAKKLQVDVVLNTSVSPGSKGFIRVVKPEVCRE